jgi:hypothetical protein
VDNYVKCRTKFCREVRNVLLNGREFKKIILNILEKWISRTYIGLNLLRIIYNGWL